MNTSEAEMLSCASHQENIGFSVFYILVFIIAVPGNALALWAFIHQRNTSSSQVFLRHLSFADIFYVLILPMRVVYHLSDCHWPFGHTLCQLAGFLFYLNMYCSLYFMSFISLDRYIAVVHPLRSKVVRKGLYANIVVGILWVMVIILMTPVLFSKRNSGSTTEANNGSVTCKMLYLQSPSPSALVSNVVAFVIPLTTIMVSYILILLKLRLMQQQEDQPVRNKAIRMIMLIMMNFLVAFIPYHVSRVIYIRSYHSVHMSTVSRKSVENANQITSALMCISGVLDPVMYFFLSHTYREKLLQLFCKNEEEDL